MSEKRDKVRCGACGAVRERDGVVVLTMHSAGEAPFAHFYCVSGGERAGCWSSVFAAILGAARALEPRLPCEASPSEAEGGDDE